MCVSYHTLVPDEGHSLLSAVGALRDEAEVVFAHGALGSVKGAMGTASHLQITTAHGDRERESRQNQVAL